MAAMTAMTLDGWLFTTEAMQRCFGNATRLEAMLAVETALAIAQGRPDLAQAIQTTNPDPAAIGTKTATAGVPAIPFVEGVQAALPPSLEPFFHNGATSQDIMDTALALLIRDALALLTNDLAPILAGLAAMATTHRATPCAGRTYGQHAAPVTFGYKAAVWLTGIADAVAQLPAIRAQVLIATLGGPVGTYARGPAEVDAFAAILHLHAPPLAGHTLRGRQAALGAWLAGLLGALAKMATDIQHLASTEVAEVHEPALPGRGGSSAMPHKRNPVGCTIILAGHLQAPGHVATLLHAMAAAHERPAGAWHAEWQAIPALFGLTAAACREAKALAAGLVIDPERMRANLDLTRSLLFADRAAALLTPTMGRAAAHAHVEHAAATVRNTGRHLADVLGPDCAAAFDLAPAIAAAQPWIDRALDHAALVSDDLQTLAPKLL